MSNRSMLEINHDHAPKGDDELLIWAKKMREYLASGNPDSLPDGVKYVYMRHHTENYPAETMRKL